MTGKVNINNANIIQTNTEKQAQTIYVNTDSTANILYTDITLNAPEINSEDNTKLSAAIYSKGIVNTNHNNININTTKTEENEKITSIIYPYNIISSTITIKC